MVRNIEFKTGQNDFQRKSNHQKMYWRLPTKQQVFMKCHQISTTLYLKTASLKHTKKLTSLRKPELIKKLEISKTFEIRQEN